MLSKITAGLTAVAAAVTVSAASIVSFQLNYYCEGGEVKLLKAPSPGVKLEKRLTFRNPKLIGFAYPVEIDLDKTTEMEATLVVTRGSGRIVPSLSGRHTGPRAKRGPFTFVCTGFEFCGEPAAKKLPFTVTKWTNMLPAGVFVTEGETITIKASFKKVK
ncbi:MAG: hypothetical protein IJJ28_07310 [Lentisphaeria bacterium]|nr:hypothetical protein [Lentisphaeria bacterium]